jgi:hypothetical protein
MLQRVFFLPVTILYLIILFFHIFTIWFICNWKWLFLVTSNWRTKYIWIQYILLLLWDFLASLPPPFIHLTKLQWNDSWSLVWPLDRLLCCVLLIYMHTTNKSKGKVFSCLWWWHIWGGTALLHLFLIVAPDGGEWSYFLCCNQFSIRRTPGLDMTLGWPLN